VRRHRLFRPADLAAQLGLNRVYDSIASALAAQQRHDPLRPSLDQVEHVLTPAQKRVRDLALVAMPVIDGFDAALHVVYDKLGDMGRHANPAHAGAYGSPQSPFQNLIKDYRAFAA